MKLDDKELYWLVGILEGEGYFGLENKRGVYSLLQIRLKMTDVDIVYKAAGIISKITNQHHNVYFEDPKGPNCSTTCQIAVKGAAAKKIMKLIVSHMGARRRKKIWQCLNGHHEPKAKGKLNRKINITKLLEPTPSNVVKIARRF